MMPLQRFLICLILFLSLWFNYGCAAIFAAGAITGVGQYIKYAMDSIANRTFIGNLNYVTEASINVLKKMKIQINTVKKHEEGAKIHAYANDLTIKIYLQPITNNTTKVTIDASKYSMIKDKATAQEIISQIDLVLSDQTVLLGKRKL